MAEHVRKITGNQKECTNKQGGTGCLQSVFDDKESVELTAAGDVVALVIVPAEKHGQTSTHCLQFCHFVMYQQVQVLQRHISLYVLNHGFAPKGRKQVR